MLSNLTPEGEATHLKAESILKEMYLGNGLLLIPAKLADRNCRVEYKHMSKVHS